MGRADFTLVTHPDHQPAVDFITRSSEGPFIDTGLSVQLRQRPGMPIVTERVYLSVHTVNQLASIIANPLGGPELAQARLVAQGKVEYLKEDLGERIRALAADLAAIADAAGIGNDALAVHSA